MAEERRKDVRAEKTEKVVAEERPEVKSGKGRHWRGIFSEKFQDAVIVGLLIPSAIELGKKIFDHFTKKAEVKVLETLGINESGKGLGEEIGFTDAVNQLDNAEAIKIQKFEAFLGSSLVDRGQDRLVAFHVFVASGVKEKGVAWGRIFLRELLLNTTAEKKFNFLKNRGAFSTLKPEKKPAQMPEFLKSACGVSVEKVKQMATAFEKSQAANTAELANQTSSLKNWAKNWRDAGRR